MKPFIKWPGGKTEELKIILKHLPNTIKNFYEPFVGGGAVYFSLHNINQYFINDKSGELTNLYKAIQSQNDTFFEAIQEIDKSWAILEKISNYHALELFDLYQKYKFDHLSDSIFKQRLQNFFACNITDFNDILNSRLITDKNKLLIELESSLFKKLKRLKKIEFQKGALSKNDVTLNIETGFKSGLYTYFRFLYNNSNTLMLKADFISAIYYFIREYCYSSMFRYNKNGEFNVPYGGISYNKKYLTNKIEYIKSIEMKEKLNKTNIYTLDFEAFFSNFNLNKNDFIFLDPPYDTSFSTYANNIFSNEDHIRLANFCKTTNANFMLVIKNTDFIYELYKNFNIKTFDKKYTVSFQNRNDKKAEHLLITNY